MNKYKVRRAKLKKGMKQQKEKAKITKHCYHNCNKLINNGRNNTLNDGDKEARTVR